MRGVGRACGRSTITTPFTETFHPALDFESSLLCDLVVSPRGVVRHGINGTKDRPAKVLSETFKVSLAWIIHPRTCGEHLPWTT